MLCRVPECPLKESIESRRRAWRELQKIRRLLALVIDNLPPPPKPPEFAQEGAILRAALAKAIREPWGRLEALEKAVEGVKPYLSNTLNDGKYPLAVLDLNRATGKAQPSPEVLRKLGDLGQSENVNTH